MSSHFQYRRVANRTNILRLLRRAALGAALWIGAGQTLAIADWLVPAKAMTTEGGDFTNISLEELMNIEVNVTGTLTRTRRNLVPAAVTRIDALDIEHAAPRSLTELMDIYVPNFEWDYHTWEMHAWGARGILGDDKYLLLVNGRPINDRQGTGAISERDLPLLWDLRQVDVVRGPGSATYGPGAISMVVNQQTESGLTYEGTGVMVRQGAIEEFTSAEFRHGHSWAKNRGYFLYGGIAQYSGADSDDSPIVQGQSFTGPLGVFRPGEPLPFSGYADDKRAYKDLPHLKFHAQIDVDGLTAWTRYSRGGKVLPLAEAGMWAPPPIGWTPGTDFSALVVGVGYQQWTNYLGYKTDLSKTLKLDVSTSFDFTEYERTGGPDVWDNIMEAKWLNRAIVNWTPNEKHELAVGVEYAYYVEGLPGWRTPSLDDGLPEFYSHMLSFVGEHQFHINDHWTTIVSARVDKNRFTDWLFSPRAAVAYTPTDRDTLKFIASQSLRTNVESTMRDMTIATGQKNDPETMQSLELRYERQQNANFSMGASVFYNDLEEVNWEWSTGTIKKLGDVKTAGIELEAKYHTDDTTIMLSHSFTKLVGISIEEDVSTITSAAPYGFGYDLNNWANQITKLSIHQELTKKWSADSSIRVMWDSQGNRDYANYLNEHPHDGVSFPTAVPGYEKPYWVSAFLDAGVQYKLNKNLTFRVDAYNILGWIDTVYNKRDIRAGVWDAIYRSEAASFGISLKCEF